MLSLPLSFLLCFPELPHSTTMSPCLLFVSQMSLSVQCQLFFLAFSLFCPTDQVTRPLPPRILLFFSFHHRIFGFTFSAFFLFHHKSHFAYHHTVLLCDTLSLLSYNRTFPSSAIILNY